MPVIATSSPVENRRLTRVTFDASDSHKVHPVLHSVNLSGTSCHAAVRARDADEQGSSSVSLD